MANVAIRARMTNAYYSSLLSDLPIFKKFSLKTNKQQTKTTILSCYALENYLYNS